MMMSIIIIVVVVVVVSPRGRAGANSLVKWIHLHSYFPAVVKCLNRKDICIPK